MPLRALCPSAKKSVGTKSVGIKSVGTEARSVEGYSAKGYGCHQFQGQSQVPESMTPCFYLTATIFSSKDQADIEAAPNLLNAVDKRGADTIMVHLQARRRTLS